LVYIKVIYSHQKASTKEKVIKLQAWNFKK